MEEVVVELSSTKTQLTIGYVKSVENAKEERKEVDVDVSCMMPMRCVCGSSSANRVMGVGNLREARGLCM